MNAAMNLQKQLEKEIFMGHDGYSRKVEKWEEIFEIYHDDKSEDKSLFDFITARIKVDDTRWVVRDKRTKEIVGRYKDHIYAVKQARHKYKKIMNKIDKILLR
jgi:hypothetical protein